MPKVKYSKELILNTAIELTKKSGLEAINVRDLAKELGCSVAPIYTAFGSFDQLLQAVKDAFIAFFMEYATKNYSKDSFLNIGIGIVRFAIDYPKVYHSFFLQGITVEDETSDALMEILEHHHPLKDWLNKEELKDIMRKMDIFTNGLCSEIVLGNVSSPSNLSCTSCSSNSNNLTLEKCEKLLSEVGQEIIIGTLVKKGLYDSVKNMLMGK